MSNLNLTDTGTSELHASQHLVGTVLACQANYYWVRLDNVVPDQDNQGDVRSLSLLCTRRSRLKKIGQQVWVGDRVYVEEPDWIGGRGAIADVLPRQTALDRPPIANVNQIFLVFALAEPDLDPVQLSRFLVKAESTGLQVCLGLNKSDLVSQQDQNQWRDRLLQWGYSPIIFSLQIPQNIALVHAQLDGKVTVVSGPSGVGKSSLINSLIPTVDLRVGRVSGKLGRGRHTTRHVELFELPSGGLLADTPGFNQPELDLTPHQLSQCFPEIRQRLAEQPCQFSNCLHKDEPNCSVRGNWERYEHYLMMLDKVIAQQEASDRLGEDESTVKVKTGDAGQSRLEPKLEAKRYRRPSRRSQRQALQSLYDDIADGLESGEIDDLADHEP